MKQVCVFCGSSMGVRPIYREMAQRLGASLAQRELGLVYGGGNIGLMGVVADAALAAGGQVIGVIPDFLATKEVAHHHLTQLHVVPSMHDRKALMAELSDAFIALPGGCGTFEEFFEVLTWGQLGLHQKPYGLLNVAGYYDPLLELLDRSVAEQFLKVEFRELVLADGDVDRLLDRLATLQIPQIEKLISRTST